MSSREEFIQREVFHNHVDEKEAYGEYMTLQRSEMQDVRLTTPMFREPMLFAPYTPCGKEFRMLQKIEKKKNHKLGRVKGKEVDLKVENQYIERNVVELEDQTKDKFTRCFQYWKTFYEVRDASIEEYQGYIRDSLTKRDTNAALDAKIEKIYEN